MKKWLYLLLLFGTVTVQAQKIAVIKYEELQERMQEHNAKTLLVNFWATWCVPCIEEMPLLMEMNEKYKNAPDFKMVLVSLDTKNNLGKLPAFIEKHNITAEVVLLDDNKRMNEWIPDLEQKWQGNLPATFVYHQGAKVSFIDGEVTREGLESIAGKFLSPSK